MTDERYVCRVRTSSNKIEDAIWPTHKDAAFFGAQLWEELGLRSQIIKASDAEGWGGK